MPNNDPAISEVWTARIYFKGNSGINKPRPVLVVNVDEENNYTIQEITSVKPKEPPTFYDNFKELIDKWKESGLDEPSYVKCAPSNTHKVERIRLHGYVGVMAEEDFENIIEKIIDAKEKLNS